MVALQMQNSSLLFHRKSTDHLLLCKTFLLPPASSTFPSSYPSFPHPQKSLRRPKLASVVTASTTTKIIRNRQLDRVAEKHNRIRFATKLKTLLLSKPHHHLPLNILDKCRPYLSIPSSRSLPPMIARYPSLFELYVHPTNDLPSVRLTPAALRLAAEEATVRSFLESRLVAKLQKLLMLSKHRRIKLDKLVHIAADLGLPANFRSRLCNDHPSKFRIIDTSYGRSLELVSWDPQLAIPCPDRASCSSSELIIDRPLRFKQLRLPKGVNLKRKHKDYLLNFVELPAVSPYLEGANETERVGVLAEKRACGVVREVLAMTVEKRTLVDHLTHFRRDLGLSNQVRGMLVRHPELFYVSTKGVRNSVFLVEGYQDGKLVEKDELVVAKERLVELIREGKKMRRLRRDGLDNDLQNDDDKDDDGGDDDEEDGYDDDFNELVRIGVIGPDWEEISEEEATEESEETKQFWSVGAIEKEAGGLIEPW